MPWSMVGEAEKTRSRPPRRTCSFTAKTTRTKSACGTVRVWLIQQIEVSMTPKFKERALQARMSRYTLQRLAQQPEDETPFDLAERQRTIAIVEAQFIDRLYDAIKEVVVEQLDERERSKPKR